MTPRYVRREPLDALEIDGESLLLLPPDQVVRLSIIGTAIVAAAAAPISADGIATEIQARFGEPEDGDVLGAIFVCCAALVEAGALEMVADE